MSIRLVWKSQQALISTMNFEGVKNIQFQIKHKATCKISPS